MSNAVSAALLGALGAVALGVAGSYSSYRTVSAMVPYHHTPPDLIVEGWGYSWATAQAGLIAASVPLAVWAFIVVRNRGAV